MKNSQIKTQAAQLAEAWSGAYRADWRGRDVSEKLIEELLSIGFNVADAEEVYRSKHLRWFFDSVEDEISVKSARRRFREYSSKTCCTSGRCFRANFSGNFASRQND